MKLIVSEIFQVHTSYPCSEHYFGGLFSPYGPRTLVSPVECANTTVSDTFRRN